MGSAPGLIRFAARYTRSLHDAEDAYQRAMEIALTKAPVTDQRPFMAWLHTVLRNEALAVSRMQRREGPGVAADVPEAYENDLQSAVSLDALTEWRERYRTVQDGLAGLAEAQRVCLMLQAAGASYERIREITGFSLRKVERSVLEGRARLAAWEVRLASGEDCARMDPLIDRVALGRAGAKEGRLVSRHVRHCGHCRALLRDRRESNEWLAGLVPVSLVGGQVFAGAPDPSPAIAWWERVSGGATVRMGSMVQMAMDLPSSALAKVGAGTAAVAVAGAAGAPLVANAVRPGVPDPQVAAITRPADRPVVVRPEDDTRTQRSAQAFAPQRRAATLARARAHARHAARPVHARSPRPQTGTNPDARTVSASVSVTKAAARPAQRVSSPARSSEGRSPSPSAVALEFGP
jgi:RNA polymerase sigma factor (sigma-70 family)